MHSLQPNSFCDVSNAHNYVTSCTQAHRTCQHPMTSQFVDSNAAAKALTSSPAGASHGVFSYRHLPPHAQDVYADYADVVDDACAYQAMQYTLHANTAPAHTHSHAHAHVSNPQWYFMCQAHRSQQVSAPEAHLHDAAMTSATFAGEAEVEDGEKMAQNEENRPKYSWLKQTKSRAAEWKRGWPG